MTVYFTASVVGKNQYLANYQAIVKSLTDTGHTVYADHILNVSEQQIHLKSKKERLEFHDKLEHWITSADFMIVEASYPSISVGYEVSMALQRGKPVLILYATDNPPSLFAFHENERLLAEKYDITNVGKIIEEFMRYVAGIHESRFTFFITSELAMHLEKMSKKYHVPKSVYLRQLIERDINRKE